MLHLKVKYNKYLIAIYKMSIMKNQNKKQRQVLELVNFTFLNHRA